MSFLPRFGNVSLLHVTDCHAQLNPVYFREPSANIGIGAFSAQPPHLVGEAQQGGDMVRVGGLHYACDPTAGMGRRISALMLNGQPLSADRRYKVAGWAPVSEEARQAGGEPVRELMARYLRGEEVVKPRVANVPKLIGVGSNPGLAWC
jgi:2',3'-cyclic-nucleotide 2'-phosphodiesterase (5'-nucleotidase family)